MIIEFFIAVFAGSCFLLNWSSKKYDRDWALVTAIVALGISSIALIVWPMAYYGDISRIQYFKSVQQTAERGRSGDQHLEGAAFRLEIAERNGWLAKAQYWNDTIFDQFIPDEVDSLTPIE